MRGDLGGGVIAAAGALCGALGVALAARGSHLAEANLSIAANFLLMHAPALIVVGLLARSRWGRLSGWILLAGLVLFAGDLSARSLLNAPLFPFAAPLGGAGLMTGWASLALAFLLRRA
ncbi:MAG TPA: DUF423 domain-containing protein [Devosia sp.]|jgi:uncharacterized membrane protein YgdD (TMEM256/DUF423 family)|nr:DUF423 domain-containing protein [Devosia sp.]